MYRKRRCVWLGSPVLYSNDRFQVLHRPQTGHYLEDDKVYLSYVPSSPSNSGVQELPLLQQHSPEPYTPEWQVESDRGMRKRKREEEEEAVDREGSVAQLL
jgi:hypothetical protein